MATTPLTLVGWHYNDDNTARPMLVGTFVEAAPADHPDSARFQPSFQIEVEVPLPKAGKRTDRTVTPVTPEPEPAPEPSPEPPPEDEPDPSKFQTRPQDKRVIRETPEDKDSK